MFVFLYYAGRPSPDDTHPDFAPSLHLGPELANSSSKRAGEKHAWYERALKRRVLSALEPIIIIENDNQENANNHEDEGDSHDEISALRLLNGQLIEKCESLRKEVNSLRLERDFYKGIKIVFLVRELPAFRD